MSYSSSSIPIIFFLPSLIGSLFLLAIINQQTVILILFYHSLLIFYSLFFGGSGLRKQTAKNYIMFAVANLYMADRKNLAV